MFREKVTRRRDDWNEKVPRMVPERIARTIRDTSPRHRSGLEDRIKNGVTFWKR
jgi:hypothetical protein